MVRLFAGIQSRIQKRRPPKWDKKLAETPTDLARQQDSGASPLTERFATEATGTAHGIVDVACNVRELSLRISEQERLLASAGQKMAELGVENTRIVASAESSRHVAEETGADWWRPSKWCGVPSAM